MATGQTPSGQRRRGPVAGRGRSLRPPAPPEPLPRQGRFLHWSGWPKLGAALTTIATLAVAAGTVGALYFTNQTLHATSNQYGLEQQKAVTDRFRLAAEQLASDKIDVRISGIYLLERLAKDSPADHPTVFAILAAFLRIQSPLALCGIFPSPDRTIFEPRADIQTALTVIGRREVARDTFERRMDLRRTCLVGADLVSAHLPITDLSGADLSGAQLGVADISNTVLIGTNLTRASLRHSDLHNAHLAGANLAGAVLTEANLTSTDFTGANLTGVDLRHANLTGAVLIGVVYDDATRWPDGYTPPPR